ncbi:MAG: ABC transporter substrate-binding protein [Desulfobacterales bacterium]|jgi:ABC-type transport system substrate-binding protein
MTIRRFLIIAPLAVLAVLLQSYFWVPTYEEQTRGNPERLGTFITALNGDASVLNPILSADTASSSIESMVYEGLIDRDENLRFRGRLAESWEISEVAFFYVVADRPPAGSNDPSPAAVARLLRSAAESTESLPEPVRRSLENIQRITIEPPRRFTAPYRTSAGAEIELEVSAPARVRLELAHVDPDLFERLSQVLGDTYFSAFSPDRYIEPTAELPGAEAASVARRLLPPVEHNPILLFHLRPGVKFHDGHLFGAGDVKFTYEAIMNPKNLSPRTADYEPVKQVEVVDPLTVRIVYKRLYSPAIGTWGMGILPEHLLNKSALAKEAEQRGLDPKNFTIRQSRFNRNPVGCGPFRFDRWKSDQYIELSRFEGYWEGPANYKAYISRIIPDPLTQEMEFYAGTIDDYSVEPHQVQRLREDPRFQSFSGTAFGYTYIGYNARRKPFDDPRVRRALGMAIDVDKIIQFILYGQAERITGPFVKQTDYYNHDIAPLSFDPRGALDLLRSAGWERNAAGQLVKDGKPFQFTLITNSGNDLRKAILAVAQDAWRSIGIEVRTDLLEWSVFLQERINKLDFDAVILGWSMGIDPDLFQIWHSSQSGPNQLNFVGFANPEADALIVRIRREYDHRKQVAECRRLHEIIAAEQPYTFLYVSKWTAVLDKRIVIRNTDESGNPVYAKITPTPTGNYRFYFNRWVKLPQVPEFAQDG